jgi:hypothetical protein
VGGPFSGRAALADGVVVLGVPRRHKAFGTFMLRSPRFPLVETRQIALAERRPNLHHVSLGPIGALSHRTELQLYGDTWAVSNAFCA